MNDVNRIGRIVTAAATISGLMVASLMMYVAWRHNPQGAFHEERGGAVTIHWFSWLQVGLSWFLPIAALGIITALVGTLRARRTR